MGTDRYAYQSRLRRVSPLPKLLLTVVALVICLCCDSVAVGIATLILMGVLITALGGLSPGVYLHFLKVPLIFLVIGTLTPPVGVCLFVSSSISGEKVVRIGKASIPFILCMVAVMFLVVLFPELATFVPSMIEG